MSTQTRQSGSPLTPDSYELSIDGMTCQHCVARVEAAILAVPDVVSADVQLDAGRATVSGGLP
ncbi:MAG: heavy metal-associated domain-containing protein, partial [Thiogranum sp.]